MTFLDEVFGNKLLALKSIRGVDWAPHSCDLNPLDYFMWPYLKSIVYKPFPKDIDDLMQKDSRACDEIPSELIRKLVLPLKSRSTKVL